MAEPMDEGKSKEQFDDDLETILKTILQNEIAAGQQGKKYLHVLLLAMIVIMHK